MKFEIDKHEKYVLLKPLDIEELNSEKAPKLKSEFNAIEVEEIRNIILDLSNVYTADESGISAILYGARMCRNNVGTFVLVGVSNDLQKILGLSTTENYLNIVPTVTEAIDFVFMEEIERDLNNELGNEYQLAFANGGYQNNDTIPEREVCERLGIQLLDGLGDKIQSSSWLIGKDLIERTNRYLELFLTKNVKGLENEMYSETVHLRDWNGEWKGRYSVLEMNENLFNADFHIVPLDIKQADNTTIATFNLHIAGTMYKVVDIIEWDDDGKIKTIFAYNG